MIHPQIKRGDIYLYDFGSAVGSVQGHLRPCIVIQNDKQNMRSPTTIIAPLTSKTRKKSFMLAHVPVSNKCVFSLRSDSQILLEQLQTIPKALLGPYIGHVDDEQILKAIDLGLCKTLGIKILSGNTDTSEQEVSV